MWSPSAENSLSSSASSRSGGGRSVYACQYRRSITYGCSHARTFLRACGHVTGGGSVFRAFLFPPVLLLGGGSRGARLLFEDHRRRWRTYVDGHLLRAWPRPPAETERAAHQLPVAADGHVAPHLVMGPPQGVLYLLVALLYPAPEGVEPAHLCQVRPP